MACYYLLHLRLFLRKHAHTEVSVLVRLKGGGNDEIFSRRKFKTGADLSKIDEGLGSSLLCMWEEIILIQMNLLLPAELQWGIKTEFKLYQRKHEHWTRWCHSGWLPRYCYAVAKMYVWVVSSLCFGDVDGCLGVVRWFIKCSVWVSKRPGNYMMSHKATLLTWGGT